MEHFRGHYAHTMDSKGRVSLPARYREVLEANDPTGEKADRVILTHALDGNLDLYSLDKWTQFERKLQELPAFKTEVKHIKRVYIGSAKEVSLDSNGRLLVPKSMREYADLDREVVWVGQLDKVELWDQSEWESVAAEAQADPEAVQEAITELGL
jgi:MraZ protein